MEAVAMICSKRNAQGGINLARSAFDYRVPYLS